MSDSIFLTDGSGVITGLVDTSYAGELVIPEYVNGEKIIVIGYQAFLGCSNITSVTIPDSVININYGAFNNCTSLTSFTIPDSVTSIGGSAFYNCYNLTSITIPNSVINIDNYAFRNCRSLETIYVTDPNNLSTAVSSYDWSNTGSIVAFALYVNPIRNVDYLIKSGTLIDLADKIRILSGTEDSMTPATMDTKLDSANAEVDIQTNLIDQISSTLTDIFNGSTSGSGNTNSGTGVEMVTGTLTYMSMYHDYSVYYNDGESIVELYVNSAGDGYIDRTNTVISVPKNSMLVVYCRNMFDNNTTVGTGATEYMKNNLENVLFVESTTISGVNAIALAIYKVVGDFILDLTEEDIL